MHIDALLVKDTQILHHWLNKMNQRLGWEDSNKSLAVLKATLHALRAYLPVNHVAHLGSMLPLTLRGIFFENWHPTELSFKERNVDHFLNLVKQQLPHNDIDLKPAVRAVFKTFAEETHEAEVEKIRSLIPNDIREFWDQRWGIRRQEPGTQNQGSRSKFGKG